MNFKDVRLSLRLAVRDMRGGARALGLLIAGVFVGVAAVALVGAASDTLRTGAKSGALDGVGGDISLRLFHNPPTSQHLGFLKAQGEVSVTSELRPMVNGTLVELKGVDENYPLYGTATLQSGLSLHEALANNGAVADADLGLKIGDELRIGAVSYRLNGILISEPDRAFRAFSLGPRVMVQLSSLSGTGLATAGAEIYYYTHLKLRVNQDAAKVLSAIDKAFPDAGWRMVNAREGVPGVERTLSMAHVVLLFMGLGILLIGGAGISSAVRAHINAKLSTIAILKSIGTPPNVVALTIGLEVMAAASVGAVLGVGIGAFAPMMVASALVDHVPFALSGIPAVKPLLAAALFGVLIALLFAWWPLMSVGGINARLLLRERFDHVPGGAGMTGWLGAAVIVLLILGLVFWVSPMAILSAVFLVVSLFLAAFYLGLGWLIARVAKRLSKGRSAGVRMALGNLYRAGSPTSAVVMALGLTLTLLVALDGLGRAANHHVQNALPNQAPDVVAFSLSRDQAQGLRQNLQDWAGTERLKIKPFLHARIQALNGIPVQDLNIPKSLSWVIRGDRGVSYDEQDNGAAGLSVDAGIAEKLGLNLGDTITLNVSGHVVTAPVKAFLDLDWTGLDLVFPIVASKVTLSSIPHTFAGALKAKPGRVVDMENRIKANFPDVPLIRVDDVLASLVTALNAMVQGLTMAAMLCGVAALVVLAGSILQGLRSRTDEALLFKVLGARQSQLLGQLAIEFVALGLVVALVAVPLGLGIAFGVAKAAGLTSASIGLGGGFQLAGLAIFVTVTVGLLVTSGAYRASPSTYLRRRGV